MDGQGTKWRRNTAENLNWLSRVHERYRRQTDRQTDRRQTDGRRHIANVNVTNRNDFTDYNSNITTGYNKYLLTCCQSLCSQSFVLSLVSTLLSTNYQLYPNPAIFVFIKSAIIVFASTLKLPLPLPHLSFIPYSIIATHHTIMYFQILKQTSKHPELCCSCCRYSPYLFISLTFSSLYNDSKLMNV